MVAGKRLQEHTVKQQILDGLYSTNLPDAFRRFGTDFVEVYPIHYLVASVIFRENILFMSLILMHKIKCYAGSLALQGSFLIEYAFYLLNKLSILFVLFLSVQFIHFT